MLLAAGMLGILGLTALAGANYYLDGQRKAAAFSLSPTATPTSQTTPAPTVSDGLQTACRLPTSRRQTGDLWMAGTGTQAGFRAHETFMDVVPLPHEAVARTDRVAGYLQELEVDGAHVVIQSGCFAVELNGLTSIDSLPGMRAQDRDELYPQILDTRTYPLAIMKLHRSTVPKFGSKPQRLSVSAELTIKDTTRPVSLTVDAQTTSGGVQAVGSMAINARDFTVYLPGDGEDSPIRVDPHLTLEFLLVLNPAS